MATGSSQSVSGSADASNTNLYPTQRHAGKVGYGPNFAAGGSLVNKITGLAYEVKGKVTHDPALVHHGHEVFTGEAERKKILGIDDEDTVFEPGQDTAKKLQENTQETSGSSPPHGKDTSSAESQDKSTSSASGTKSAKDRVLERSGS